MKQRLKPCPFCGSQKIEVIFLRSRAFVACLECGAQGPEENWEGWESLGTLEAIRARAVWRWNLHGSLLEEKISSTLKVLDEEGVVYEKDVRSYLRKKPWLLDAISLQIKTLKKRFPEATLALVIHTSPVDRTTSLDLMINALSEEGSNFDDVQKKISEAIKEYWDLEENPLREVQEEIHVYPWRWGG